MSACRELRVVGRNLSAPYCLYFFNFNSKIYVNCYLWSSEVNSLLILKEAHRRTGRHGAFSNLMSQIKENLHGSRPHIYESMTSLGSLRPFQQIVTATRTVHAEHRPKSKN